QSCAAPRRGDAPASRPERRESTCRGIRGGGADEGTTEGPLAGRRGSAGGGLWSHGNGGGDDRRDGRVASQHHVAAAAAKPPGAPDHAGRLPGRVQEA